VTVPENALPNHVDDSTLPKNAAVQPTLADTATHASNVSNLDMAKITALSKIDMAYGMRPKYLCYNLWSSEEEANSRNTSAPPSLADWTEYAKPLPSVPNKELANINAMKTIRENPHLFKIVMPINIDRFEELLIMHPNRLFVDSVCRGLREGFWPWADTHYDTYPSVVDKSLEMPQKKEEVKFL
jgi:hypothetical protein